MSTQVASDKGSVTATSSFGASSKRRFIVRRDQEWGKVQKYNDDLARYADMENKRQQRELLSSIAEDNRKLDAMKKNARYSQKQSELHNDRAQVNSQLSAVMESDARSQERKRSLQSHLANDYQTNSSIKAHRKDEERRTTHSTEQRRLEQISTELDNERQSKLMRRQTMKELADSFSDQVKERKRRERQHNQSYDYAKHQEMLKVTDSRYAQRQERWNNFYNTASQVQARRQDRLKSYQELEQEKQAKRERWVDKRVKEINDREFLKHQDSLHKKFNEISTTKKAIINQIESKKDSQTQEKKSKLNQAREAIPLEDAAVKSYYQMERVDKKKRQLNYRDRLDQHLLERELRGELTYSDMSPEEKRLNKPIVSKTTSNSRSETPTNASSAYSASLSEAARFDRPNPLMGISNSNMMNMRRGAWNRAASSSALSKSMDVGTAASLNGGASPVARNGDKGSVGQRFASPTHSRTSGAMMQSNDSFYSGKSASRRFVVRDPILGTLKESERTMNSIGRLVLRPSPGSNMY